MAKIHLTRCQHLSPFVDILNRLGSPTASLLAKFRLPTSLEGKANHYVPIFSAIEFAEFAYRSQGIEDFGFHASRQLHFGHLSEKTRNLAFPRHCSSHCSRPANGHRSKIRI